MRESLKKLLTDESSWILGLGAALLGAFGLKEVLHLSDFAVGCFLWSGGGLVALGVLLKIFLVLGNLPQPPEIVYEVMPATRSDLKAAHNFCTNLIGAHFASLEQWDGRFDKNPETLFLVKRVKRSSYRSSSRLVGCFSIIPVTVAACRLLEQNQLNATLFTPDHIIARNGRRAALYVSGIVADGFRAKGMTLSFLERRLQVATGSGDRIVYTRPMTGDGLRLAKRHQFKPVDPARRDLSAIYLLKLSKNRSHPKRSGLTAVGGRRSSRRKSTK